MCEKIEEVEHYLNKIDTQTEIKFAIQTEHEI